MGSDVGYNIGFKLLQDCSNVTFYQYPGLIKIKYMDRNLDNLSTVRRKKFQPCLVSYRRRLPFSIVFFWGGDEDYLVNLKRRSTFIFVAFPEDESDVIFHWQFSIWHSSESVFARKLCPSSVMHDQLWTRINFAIRMRLCRHYLSHYLTHTIYIWTKMYKK